MIDDNPIEEDSEGDNSDDSGGRRKRKSRSDDELDDRLEDDDYDLLEENLGVKVQRKVCLKVLIPLYLQFTYIFCSFNNVKLPSSLKCIQNLFILKFRNFSIFQKRFKRLKRIQNEDSDAEEDEGMDRDEIAKQLFDGDEVSIVEMSIVTCSCVQN